LPCLSMAAVCLFAVQVVSSKQLAAMPLMILQHKRPRAAIIKTLAGSLQHMLT